MINLFQNEMIPRSFWPQFFLTVVYVNLFVVTFKINLLFKINP